jgi:hypothetical protein
MASEPVARAVAEEVARWGAMRQTGVSLRYMMEFGARPTERTLLLAAQFLHKELPIRIARRALDLDSLPFGLSTKPAILKVVFVSCLLLPRQSSYLHVNSVLGRPVNFIICSLSIRCGGRFPCPCLPLD